MLGAELGREDGRIIGQRVLDAEGPKIESTFSAEGTIKQRERSYAKDLLTTAFSQTAC
jgi:hypothetical protein